MARRYETVYIFDSALEEPAITEKLTRFHGLLTQGGKGTITNTAHWGKRTLAFPIKKKDTGYYVVSQFEAAAELLAAPLPGGRERGRAGGADARAGGVRGR